MSTAIEKIKAIGKVPLTMSSLELVEYINSQRGEGEATLAHSDFLKKVVQVLGEVAGNFSSYYTASNGKQNPCYHLPKREACLMAMSYSYDLQAKVFDRMTELETQATPAIPKTWAQTLRLAAEQAEVMEQQQAALALAAPKVEFVDRYVAAETGSLGLRQVCKLLEVKENQFRDFLLDRRIMYRTTPNSPLTPHAEHIHARRFEAKTGVAQHAESTHAYVHYKFSPAGVNWIAGLWGQHQARLAQAGGVQA